MRERERGAHMGGCEGRQGCTGARRAELGRAGLRARTEDHNTHDH
jgi:hypothetical protein